MRGRPTRPKASCHSRSTSAGVKANPGSRDAASVPDRESVPHRPRPFQGDNDRYGHAAGDAVLRRVAQAIEHSLRAQDAVYRLGGEEFLVVLHVPNLEGLSTAAEHLRAVVIDLAIEHVDNEPHGRVSVSIGVTLIGPPDLDQYDEQWIARADDGLYEAKQAGRNRVCLRQR